VTVQIATPKDIRAACGASSQEIALSITVVMPDERTCAVDMRVPLALAMDSTLFRELYLAPSMAQLQRIRDIGFVSVTDGA